MITPEVSVIMSCFNAEDTVRRAITSILNQTFKNFEFIIIDDGSTDNTKEALQEFANIDNRIRLIFNPKNVGLAASLNIGIKASRASVIARMDADDESKIERLEKQVAFFSEHKEIDVLGCAVIQRTKAGRILGDKYLPERHQDIVRKIFRRPVVFHPTILIRKYVFEKYGMYDPAVTWAEDADLWYRIYDKVCFHNLQESLLFYTVKSRLSLRHVHYNLKVKYKNLKRRKLLSQYFPQLIMDFVSMTLKMTRYKL